MPHSPPHLLVPIHRPGVAKLVEDHLQEPRRDVLHRGEAVYLDRSAAVTGRQLENRPQGVLAFP